MPDARHCKAVYARDHQSSFPSLQYRESTWNLNPVIDTYILDNFKLQGRSLSVHGMDGIHLMNQRLQGDVDWPRSSDLWRTEPGRFCQ